MALRGKKVQQTKVDAIAAVKEKIGSAKDFIFTDYRGMTVDQITALRDKLREKNAEYHVIKNNFARIAFEQSNIAHAETMLLGPTAIAFIRDDANEIAKIFVDYAKESPVKLKGGIVDNTFFDEKQIDAFSKLPGRKQLIAMLMSTMNAPLQNFVYALNGVTTKLVRTLQAVADKKAGN